MNRSPARARRRATATWLAMAATLAVVLSSCVLKKGDQYVVQLAPPNGIHVTLRVGTSDQLKSVSTLLYEDQDVDGLLRRFNYTVRCNSYPRRSTYYGDRCAFRVLRATPVDAGLATPGVKVFWDDALTWNEFDDFRHDAIAPIRRRPGTCLHATIRNQGAYPLLWRDTNWTHRDRTDRNCR